MRPWGTRRLFRFPFRTGRDVRDDVAEEFAFHIDMRTEELVREGLDERDARARALREFGDRRAGAEACVRTGERLELRRRLARLAGDLRQDVGVGLRLLRRTPGFAAAAILTLALGIGANTAIYSVFDAVLLRPLPYPEPDRLVMISETLESGSPNSVSGGAFLDWREFQTQFEAITITSPVTMNLRRDGAPERLEGAEVSHEFLRVLGVQPLLGRGLLPEDDRPGGRNDAVLITEELWRSHFNADRAIVGRPIVLDEVPRTIVGVLPAGAWMVKSHRFFVPAVLLPGTPRAERSPHWAGVFGRLAPGASVAQADAELKALKVQLADRYPAFKQRWGVVVQPVTDVLGRFTRAPLLILLGAVVVVLLIACANVANLLFARGCYRRQELAVRAALGAGGGRLVRQILTENLTLAALGGLAGVALAFGGVAVLRDVASDVTPFAFDPRIDPRVLAIALGLTLLTGIVSGLLPALVARRPDVNATLKSGGRGATGGGHQRTQWTVVVAEVAMTVVLLSAAGLLFRSLANAATADPGFDPAPVLAFDVSLPDVTYDTRERRLAFASSLLERVRALPGVEAAGAGMAIPFSGGGYGEFFRRPDRQDDRDERTGRVDFVSPGYLESLGVRLRAGRLMDGADNRGDGARVAVVNETTARRFYPGEDAIGRPIAIAGNEYRIIGVVSDVVDRRLDVERRMFAYLPQALDASSLAIAVRARVEPASLVPTLRREMAAIDPGVALANPRTLDEAMAGSMAQRRLVLGLVGLFAATALALAGIGLYGVMAYAVAARRREFGVRLALGAVRADVVRHVLKGGLGRMGVGVAIGLLAALAVARLMTSELFEVGSGDPLVLAGTVIAVLAVALLASWLPARRASRFDPVTVLRSE